MRVTKKMLEDRAKLIHPEMRVFESDPRCGKLYAFGMFDEYGRQHPFTVYLPAKELLQWSDGFYNYDHYETLLYCLINHLNDD